MFAFAVAVTFALCMCAPTFAAATNDEASVTFDGAAFVFDADITVSGYDHKLMQAVDVLVRANYSASISNVHNTVNNLETSVTSMETTVSNSVAEMADMANTVHTQLAHVRPYNSPLAHNCSVGAACPCLPLSPCDQGKVCMAQGTLLQFC